MPFLKENYSFFSFLFTIEKQKPLFDFMEVNREHLNETKSVYSKLATARSQPPPLAFGREFKACRNI